MKVSMVKEDVERIDLIPFGDWHIGSRDCQLDKIESMIKWIKNNPLARVILMGDLLDAGLRTSVGAGTFDNNMTPEEQYDLCLELLTPIKDKIYGVHLGNHEQRIINATSMDLMKSLARELGTKYLDSSCIHRIVVKGNSYQLFTTHGSSGSTLPHTKMKFLRDFANYIDADVYVAGHVHELDTASDVKLYLDIGDKMIKQKKRYYVITGHYLKYGGYAEAKGYMPGKTGSPKIQLFGDKYDIHVSI